MTRTGPAPGRSSPPTPVPGEVHVWRVDLGPAIAVPAESGVLSGEERARAGRFQRPADCARSLAARASLRELLSRYVGAAPAALRFTAGPHGKPELEQGVAAGAPRFNLAHSGRLVLLAFAACDVGVDVEQLRDDVEIEGLARRFFAPEEIAAIHRATRGVRQVETFFRIWTRKEAFLKAMGTGLRDGLSWHDIEVVNDRLGKPELLLTGMAMELFMQQNLTSAFLSLSHDSGTAIAMVVLEKV